MGKIRISEDIQQDSKNISPEDFELLKVIGRGAYGKVYKARFKRDN